VVGDEDHCAHVRRDPQRGDVERWADRECLESGTYPVPALPRSERPT
jgi:hypothetical protein